MARTKELTSVDIFKFIAAIMVVALHTQPFMPNDDAAYWMTCICRIGVPFFFVAGSYFYFKSNKPIKAYIKRLLTLYLVWFVIEIPFIYERFFVGTTFLKGMAFFTRGLLIHNTFFASWYITASWQATLIVYLLSKRSNILLYIIGALCAFLSVSNAMYAHLFDNIAWNTLIKITTFLFASNSFVAAIPFVIIGRYIALNEEKLSEKINLAKFGLVASILIGIFEIIICKEFYAISDSFWSLYPISFFLVILFVKYNISISNEASRLLRNMSILVYLLHVVIIHIIIKGISNIEEGMILFFWTAFIAISTSLIIVILSKKIKILKYLY